MSSTKTVAILGNGVVGIEIAKGFAANGYTVVFGTRDPHGEKSKAALAAIPSARVASFTDAASEADIAFVALPWDGLEAGLAAAGAENLAGKLVIDASNPLDFSQGAPKLAVGFNHSAGELVQRLLPQSRVVKAFNTIGAGMFVQPKFEDGTADMFIAGNDAEAKAEVTSLLRTFGWRGAIDAGDITASRLLEPVAMLWVNYGVTHNHWTHGFSLLRQA